MRNYLCHKERSNDLRLTKSVTRGLRTQLIDDVYIDRILQDSLFTEISFSTTWYQIISKQRVPLIICCPRCQIVSIKLSCGLTSCLTQQAFGCLGINSHKRDY